MTKKEIWPRLYRQLQNCGKVCKIQLCASDCILCLEALCDLCLVCGLGCVGPPRGLPAGVFVHLLFLIRSAQTRVALTHRRAACVGISRCQACTGTSSQGCPPSSASSCHSSCLTTALQTPSHLQIL